ncbi:MAG TPA: CPBP family intramembrane glutamic endopeptidase [Pyrinomonadaceae bacterium]|nr:CPBP family intramembrane glutamic endopeptidase [Pyrinomonadaceae bacterium]
MKRESSLPHPPGFWHTVRLLLSVARRRSNGRISRQQELLQHRTGSRTNTISALGVLGVWVMGAFLNGVTATVLHSAVMEAQSLEAEQQGKIVMRTRFFAESLTQLRNATGDEDKERAEERLESSIVFEAERRVEELGGSKEEHRQFLREAVKTRSVGDFIPQDSTQPGIHYLTSTGPLPLMVATLVLLGWLLMLIFQGEGLELDIQRRRNPMWEWLFSHPVRPGAVFLAEMLAPIAANPIYATGPLFFGILYGSIHGSGFGFVAAVLVGVPVVVGAASLGKALEIGIMLRFPPRTRGALIGLMSWFGYAMMIALVVSTLAMPQIIKFSATVLRPLAITVPFPVFAWATGLEADGSFSFLSGMLACWFASAAMIGGGLAFSMWGAQRGLAGSAVAAKPASRKKTAAVPFVKRDPLYRKEILWFLRDRGAIVQAVLIPVTVAAVEIVNFRIMFQGATDSWRNIAGIGVVFGTYFLWVLGPRSLASEGQALWLAQTWPRGLEDLMKAKARLWFRIATSLVAVVFVFAILRSPLDAWKVVLVAAGWLAFGRSMAEKSVTLVTVTSSSGEQEPIPKGRRWAAALGMLTFAIGILGNRWELAVVGIVYSWITAAAMWESFRARLPFLFDPWSERVPHPPTLLHAMIAVSAFVEGGAVITGLTIAFVSIFGGGLALAQALGVALVAIIVSLVTAKMLGNRGVQPGEIWRWNEDAAGKKFFRSVLAGCAGGLLLGLLAKVYVLLLWRFDMFAQWLREGEKQMESIPNLWLSFAFIAVVCAPFAEEYLFRGLLFRALDREWGGWRALIGSAAFFTIYHPPFSWPPVFLVGLATALIFRKTGRLAGAVALHMVYNALVILQN